MRTFGVVFWTFWQVSNKVFDRAAQTCPIQHTLGNEAGEKWFGEMVSIM